MKTVLSGAVCRHRTMIRFSTLGKREHERGHIRGEQSISACIQPKHDKKTTGKSEDFEPIGANNLTCSPLINTPRC